MLKLNYLFQCSFFVLMFGFITNGFSYTVIAIEEGSIIYYAKDNKVVKEKGMYKLYFEIDEKQNIVKRVKIIALLDSSLFKKGDIIPDNTIYKIITPYQKSILTNEETINAVGQPGTNATELLTISKDYLMFSKSTGDYVVVSSAKIIERSDIK